MKPSRGYFTSTQIIMRITSAPTPYHTHFIILAFFGDFRGGAAGPGGGGIGPGIEGIGAGSGAGPGVFVGGVFVWPG